MNVTIEKCGDELIAALAGEIDHHNSKQIREAIDAELDSSGIGIVLGRYKVVSKGGGRLRIINANRRVERILRMAGIFSIAEYRQRRA